MGEIDLKDVANNYNKLNVIWNPEDRWHFYTHKRIEEFILNFLNNNDINNSSIINAGSGGYCYGIDEKKITHIDIAQEKISHLPNSIVADIQQIPLPDNQFDLIICVGSVINYCDPIKVIQEFNRLLKPGGQIILEFENSNTLELLGTYGYNKKAYLYETFYFQRQEKLWCYSDKFIREILAINKMKIIKEDKWHIISPLIYKFIKNENLSAYAKYIDRLFKYLFLNKVAGNTALLIQKAT